MAILHIHCDLDLETAISFFGRRESPLIYHGTLPQFLPLWGDSSVFESKQYPERYMLGSFPLEQQGTEIQDTVARDLEFKNRIQLYTRSYPRFSEMNFASSRQITKYCLDQAISCYALVQTESQHGNLLIGGCNPRNGVIIR